MTLWQALFLLLFLLIRPTVASSQDCTAPISYSRDLDPSVNPADHQLHATNIGNGTSCNTTKMNNSGLPTVVIITSLEVIQVEMNSYQDEDKNKNSNKKKAKRTLSLSKSVKMFNSILNSMGGFLSILSIFTDTSDLEVISEMFKEVHKKLDKIYNRIDHFESSMELNSLLSNYIPWYFTVINGVEMLTETYMAMAREPDLRKRRIQVENYLNYFESNQIGNNVNNLLRITTVTDSRIHKNIYKLMLRKANCNLSKLKDVQEKVSRIIMSGSELVLAYRIFKHMEKPNQKKYMNALLFYKKLYESQLWHCKETAVIRSKNYVRKMIDGVKSVPPLKRIAKMLSANFPWYSWSLGITKKRDNVRHNYVSGNQYYELKGYLSLGLSVIVVWQGVNEKSSCRQMPKANTIVLIENCKRCEKSYLFGSKAMLTSSKCPTNEYPNIKSIMDARSPQGTRSLNDRIFWIAAGFKPRGNPCKNACNNNGRCKAIPFSNEIQCFCFANFDGEQCEIEIVENTSFEKMILDLELIYSNVFKTPSISSVLIQGEDLSKQLRKMIQKINQQSEMTNILIKYIQPLQKLDYLLELNFNYQKRIISVDVFNMKMKSFLSHNDVPFIFNQLSNAILAEGFSDKTGHDFFNTFKKIIALNVGACSAQYGREATEVFKDLSRMDMTAAETILVHYQFADIYLTDDHRQTMIREAKHLTQGSKERMKNYVKYWQETSCPPLNGTHLIEVGCSAMLSYEGMRVELSCEGGRQAVPPVIECRLFGNKLNWNSSIQCAPNWSSWSEWSSCSSTCGQGSQTRSRKCLGETETEHCKGEHNETQTCSKEDCCQEKYGKFKCPVGWCLELSQVCDGIAHCASDADESTATCNYLRSGNRIALRSLGSSKNWLSLLYTDYVSRADMRYGRAQVTRCIKGDFVTKSEWTDCSGNSMLIYGSYNNGRKGQAIRYGDRIAMYYRKTNSRYRWFTCYKSYCITYICDKAPGKFDFGERGGCKENEFIIRNFYNPNATSPVRNGDIVFISNKDGSLKAGGFWDNISLEKCSLDEMDSPECKSIAWQVFIQ